MSRLYQTTDFTRFHPHDRQRDLNEANIEVLAESMRERGFIRARPILVNPKGTIFDGNHRLEAARRAGVAIWVQEDDTLEDEDIIHLNEQKAWVQTDYLKHWSSGKEPTPSYVLVKEFCQKYQISVPLLVRMIAKTSNADLIKNFRKGKFVVTEKELEPIGVAAEKANEIGDFVYTLDPGKKAMTVQMHFKHSLILFFLRGNIDMERFKVRIEKRIEQIHRCSRPSDYIKMWVDVYNFHTSNKLDIEDVYRFKNNG